MYVQIRKEKKEEEITSFYIHLFIFVMKKLIIALVVTVTIVILLRRRQTKAPEDPQSQAPVSPPPVAVSPPPVAVAGGTPDLLWVCAADMVSSVTQNGEVNKWVQADPTKTSGVGMKYGSCTLPVLDKTGEGYPFVRLVAGPGDIGHNGGYFEFGPLSLRLNTQGFTALVCVRWRGPATANWARVFDFGNGANSQNILCGRMGQAWQWNFQQHNATSQVAMGNFTDNTWQVLAM